MTTQAEMNATQRAAKNFNADGICDKCGRIGTYEFYCEGLCEICLEEETKG